MLITGNRGFIGSHIYNHFKREHIITGFDLNDSLLDQDYDVIVHMAARGLIRKSIETPLEYFEDDLALVIKLLEMARKHDSLFIFPTSGSTAQPTNPYSLSKKNAEEWIRLYGSLYGLKYYTLRFFNIYGERARKGAVYLFTKAALSGESALIYGDGSHVRDFLYVGDIPRTIDNMIKSNFQSGEYEVGSGIGTSVNQLVSKIENSVNKKIDVKYVDYVIKEADELIARNTIVRDPTPLESGITKVAEFIQKDTE